MSWTDDDDTKQQEYLDKLMVKQQELQDTINPIQAIINILRGNQTKVQISYVVEDGEKVESETKIIPKDKWGDDRTDEARLEIKDQCITKTDELLAENVDT